MSAVVWGRPEEGIKPQEPKFKTVLIHLVWVLGTELHPLQEQNALFSAGTLSPVPVSFLNAHL